MDESPEQAERTAYRAYLEAIGRTVGHAATAGQARKACPDEYAAWRAAWAAAYGQQAEAVA